MEFILLGAGLFIVWLGAVNAIFFKHYNMPYGEYAWFYLPLYFIPVALAVLLLQSLQVLVSSIPALAVMSITSLLFTVFGYWWGRNVNALSCFQYQSIQPSFRGMLHLSGKRNLVKIGEIILQQLSGALILIGLTSLNLSVQSIIASFAFMVFLFHIPAILWQGWYYGTYFMVTATLLSPVVVGLVLNVEGGLLYAATLHIVMYLLLYYGVYLLRTK